MGRPFPPESSPSRVGFGADVASAAQALIRHPSVPLVSLALVLFPGDTSRSGDHSAVASLVITAATFAVMLFYVGWLGAERVFAPERIAASRSLAPASPQTTFDPSRPRGRRRRRRCTCLHSSR